MFLHSFLLLCALTATPPEALAAKSPVFVEWLADSVRLDAHELELPRAGVRVWHVVKAGTPGVAPFEDALFVVDLKTGRLLSRAHLERSECPWPEDVSALVLEGDGTFSVAPAGDACMFAVQGAARTLSRLGEAEVWALRHPSAEPPEQFEEVALCGAACQQNRMELCGTCPEPKGAERVLTDADERVLRDDARMKGLLELVRGNALGNAQWANGNRSGAEQTWRELYRLYLRLGRPRDAWVDVEAWSVLLQASGQSASGLAHLAPRTMAEVLNNLGFALYRRGELRQARGAYAEAQALLDASHEKRPVLDLNVAELEKALGKLDAARAAYERFLAAPDLTPGQRTSASEALRSLPRGPAR